MTTVRAAASELFASAAEQSAFIAGALYGQLGPTPAPPVPNTPPVQIPSPVKEPPPQIVDQPVVPGPFYRYELAEDEDVGTHAFYRYDGNGKVSWVYTHEQLEKAWHRKGLDTPRLPRNVFVLSNHYQWDFDITQDEPIDLTITHYADFDENEIYSIPSSDMGIIEACLRGNKTIVSMFDTAERIQSFKRVPTTRGVCFLCGQTRQRSVEFCSQLYGRNCAQRLEAAFNLYCSPSKRNRDCALQAAAGP